MILPGPFKFPLVPQASPPTPPLALRVPPLPSLLSQPLHARMMHGTMAAVCIGGESVHGRGVLRPAPPFPSASGQLADQRHSRELERTLACSTLLSLLLLVFDFF